MKFMKVLDREAFSDNGAPDPPHEVANFGEVVGFGREIDCAVGLTICLRTGIILDKGVDPHLDSILIESGASRVTITCTPIRIQETQ